MSYEFTIELLNEFHKNPIRTSIFVIAFLLVVVCILIFSKWYENRKDLK